MMAPTVKQRAISGVAWSSVAHIGHQAIQFAIGILLARLLLPADFGLLGMVIVFTGFAGLFAEFGFSSAIVQRVDISDVHTSSIFWVNLVVGVVLALLFVLIAPYLAAFFAEPRVTAVARILSLTFVVAALGIVPRALLQRRMAFRSLAGMEIVAALISGGAALTLAVLGFGVWSLVAQSLVAAAIMSTLAFRVAAFTPERIYSSAAVRELLGYSANLFAFNFVNYWSRNADNLLVARLIGSAALGIYSRAYSLMLMPITQVIRVIARVMFPTLAAVQQDQDRVRRIFLRVLRMIMLITAPMMVGLLVVADSFVLALLGDRWADVIPVLRILCVVGVLQTISNPVGWIYQSQGRTDLLFRWGLGSSVVIVAAIAIGASQKTVEAVAWAYLIANVILIYPCIWIPGRLVSMKVGDVFRAVAAPVACALVMGILVWVISGLLWGLPSGVRLALQVGAGVLVYSLLVPFLCSSAFKDLTSMVREQRERRLARAVSP